MMATPRSNASNAKQKRGGVFLFRSNIQEELHVPEILSYLQPQSVSDYERKRQIIISLLEPRDKIAKKIALVSRKLSYSFLYSLPKHRSAMERIPKEDVATTILKLAVLFDVYQSVSS